ncbi:MAG: tRNA (adenosine(37)-N6)-dimethylallyltransferase MiaA [Ureaplasma sp.]|nr:tRNA (adenosine(37)-N6)-dimethylallyltransferase MiaA [Ureaplasma sp.]
MSFNKLIVVIGPTCSKKNSIANYLARKFNGSIINADAFQVYKQINVGVNKPNQAELNSIPHYLINNINYNDSWDISIFKDSFFNVYNEIINENRIPIMCGGSHLYVDSIVSGYNFTEHDLTDLMNKYDQLSNQELYDIIVEKDYEYAQKISVNNRRRLLRACALMEKEEVNMTQLALRNKPLFKTLVIMSYKDREIIYEQINQRVEQMLSNNWKQEIVELVNQYGDDIINSQCFKAIGYKEIYDSIFNNKPLDIELIKQKTRRLAKAQMTWCKNKFPNKFVFDWNKNQLSDLDCLVEEFLNND